MTYHWHIIQPTAPLVFRSGRPFAAGSRDGAHFPWPSSIAGALRTRYMDMEGWGPRPSSEQMDTLRKIGVLGPILAEHGDQAVHPLVPRPSDAVLLRDEAAGSERYLRLLPTKPDANTGSDLPSGLLPVRWRQTAKGKPAPAPAFWRLDQFVSWARGQHVDATAGEVHPWVVDRRTHVALDRRSLAADKGRLFQVEGLDFGHQRNEALGGFRETCLVLLAAVTTSIAEGLMTLGGERRLSALKPHPESPLGGNPFDATSLRRGVGLSLLTPALFRDGWRPGWLDDRGEGSPPGHQGVRLRLRAAAIDRWQGVSGWDLAAGGPRPARKATPAGSTYWFEVVEATNEALAGLWPCVLSDEPQDRLDGFGLALPRPWNANDTGDAPHAD